MRRVGVVCAVGVVLLVSACGSSGVSAKQEAARFAIAYVDHARNGCCVKGLHAFDPKVTISAHDSRWSTVWLQARYRVGENAGAEEFVLFRKPSGWKVFNGPGTDNLGCGVPSTIAGELHLTAGDCKPHAELPGYVDCSYGVPTLKPVQLVLACGDGAFSVSGLRWSHWTRQDAAGTGAAHLNDCVPSCAAGHFHTYRVALELTRPRTCGKRRVLQFTRLKWTSVTRSATLSTNCPRP